MRPVLILTIFFSVACDNGAKEASETLSKIRGNVIFAKRSCDAALAKSESMMDSEEDPRKIWVRELVAARMCLREFNATRREVSDEVVYIPAEAKQYAHAAKLYLRAAQLYTQLWDQRIICWSFPDNDETMEDEYRCTEEAERLDNMSTALFSRAEAAYKSFTTSSAKGGEK